MTTPDFILHGCGSVALTNICPRKHRQASLLWLFPLEKMPPEPHYATISHTQTHKVKTLPTEAVMAGNKNENKLFSVLAKNERMNTSANLILIGVSNWCLLSIWVAD